MIKLGYRNLLVGESVQLILNKALQDALEDAEVRSLCEKFTSEAGGSTPEQFEAIIRQEHARWGGIIKSTGYQPED